MNQKQKGFAPIVIVLMVLILAGVLGASYYLISKNSSKVNYQELSGNYVKESENSPGEIKVSFIEQNKVKIEGNALWIGDASTGNVNTGNIECVVSIIDGKGQCEDTKYTAPKSCVINLSFEKDKITAKEQSLGSCGGLNVSFDGDYLKQKVQALDNSKIVEDKNRIVDSGEPVKDVSQCKKTTTLESSNFNEIHAFIQKCNDGIGNYSIVSIERNGKIEIIKTRQIQGSDETDSPFYGFKDIKVLNDKYITYSYSFWEISARVVYSLDLKKEILGFVGSIGTTKDGKYFFTYGSGMGADDQLKIYDSTSLELVKDFYKEGGDVLYFRSCLEDSGVITCLGEVDGKQYVYNIN